MNVLKRNFYYTVLEIESIHNKLACDFDFFGIRGCCANNQLLGLCAYSQKSFHEWLFGLCK